jgi:glycosyltransferase involved in cell wall biosynthesis
VNAAATPTISVIVPVHNSKVKLQPAVKSALTQTLPPMEILVVDDASTDGLNESEVASSKVFYWRLPANIGAAAARNFAIQKVRGKLVAFLDADDEWLPTKLEWQLKKVRSENRLGEDFLCYTNAFIVGPQGAQRIANSAPMEATNSIVEEIFCKSMFLQTSSLLMSKNLAQRLQFRPSVPHDDWDLLARAENAGMPIIYEPTPLVVYNDDHSSTRLSRLSAGSASRNWIDSIRGTISRRARIGFHINYLYYVGYFDSAKITMLWYLCVGFFSGQLTFAQWIRRLTKASLGTSLSNRLLKLARSKL